MFNSFVCLCCLETDKIQQSKRIQNNRTIDRRVSPLSTTTVIGPPGRTRVSESYNSDTRLLTGIGFLFRFLSPDLLNHLIEGMPTFESYHPTDSVPYFPRPTDSSFVCTCFELTLRKSSKGCNMEFHQS
jgi:hypothetical protein